MEGNKEGTVAFIILNCACSSSRKDQRHDLASCTELGQSSAAYFTISLR